MSDDDSSPRRHRASLLNADGDLRFGLAPTPSNYKVRGETDDPDATGVFGHNTAGSGQNEGVRGRVQSTGDRSVGVLGDAVAPEGLTFGVRGITRSNQFASAGVFGDATASGTSGSTYGVVGNTAGNGFMDGDNRKPSAGVFGASNDSGITTGVWGVCDSSRDGNAGVQGKGRTDTGKVYGVRGDVDSNAKAAAGVRGRAGATGPSQAYGVHGVTDGAGYKGFGDFGAVPSIGVIGESTSATGLNYGVYGEIQTSRDGSAAVNGFGSATGNVYGVRGSVGSSMSDAAGVLGEATATTGGATGVKGVTNSSASEAAGVVGEAPGSTPAVEARGWSTAAKVGASAYLGSDQSIPSGSSFTRVGFDRTYVDHGDNFDTSVHEYVVPDSGHYFVDASLAWSPSFSSNDVRSVAITLNGVIEAYKKQSVSASTLTVDSISSTLLDLAEGASVAVAVRHDAGSGYSLDAEQPAAPKRAVTYVSVVRMG